MSVKWTKTKDAISVLESKLKCFVCDKLPVDPQLLWCKHSFCSSCIEDQSKCPKCHFPISPQEMVPDIMLSKLLQAINVAVQVSKCNEEVDIDSEENDVFTHKLQDVQTANKSPKHKGAKTSSSIKSRKESCERKAVEKQSNSVKTNEIGSVRRSSRSNSRGNEGKQGSLDAMRRSSRSKSPQKEKQGSKEAVRKSSRSKSPQKEKQGSVEALRRSSRSKSPQKEKQGSLEVVRGSSRSKSPQKEKPELSGKSNLKTKSGNYSPKASTKKNNLMTTPKPKMMPKSSTPILFSAKKVQHTNKVNSKGETPLQIACRQGKLSLVQQLLREGAEPNVKDYANWTPLCDAVGSGSLDVVRTLLKAGAAVNTPSNLNTTALVEAVLRGDRAMVELLLGHGADMHQRTALGNTALSLADDGMRALMLSCCHVNAPPPPRIPATPRAVLIDAQLPPPQLDQVKKLCHRFNLTLSTGFTEDITHVVVEKSVANTCEASTAVMLAIVSGCSVVGVDWVASCLKAEKLVAPDEFEPCGTTDHPTSDVFRKARLNKEPLLPRLFDGCHISLQHDQQWSSQLKLDTVSLITAAGAVYQPRQCDPERVPQDEATVMFHTDPSGPLEALSHVILYQAGSASHEPLLKYNMAHVKSLSLSWFHKCIQTFSVCLD